MLSFSASASPGLQRADSQPAGPHLAILTACLSIVFLAVVLTPPEWNGAFVSMGDTAIPNLCTMRLATGLPCPGCGLTRSVVAAAHGDWLLSFSQHRLGIAILFYLVVQSLARLAWLGLPWYRAGMARTCRLLDMGLIVLMALLIINWFPTLVGEIASLRPFQYC